jgi:hypothetical protein
VQLAPAELAEFEAERRRRARRQRRSEVLIGAALGVALLASAVVSEFSPARVLQGLPGVTSTWRGRCRHSGQRTC